MMIDTAAGELHTLGVEHLDSVVALVGEIVTNRMGHLLNATGRAAYLDTDRWARILDERHVYALDGIDGQLDAIAAVHFLDNGDAYLGSNFVRHPRKGTGSRLIRARLARAAASGARQANASVYEHNHASNRMLAKAGFRITDIENNTWSDGKSFVHTRVVTNDDLQRNEP